MKRGSTVHTYSLLNFIYQSFNISNSNEYNDVSVESHLMFYWTFELLLFTTVNTQGVQVILCYKIYGCQISFLALEFKHSMCFTAIIVYLTSRISVNTRCKKMTSCRWNLLESSLFTWVVYIYKTGSLIHISWTKKINCKWLCTYHMARNIFVKLNLVVGKINCVLPNIIPPTFNAQNLILAIKTVNAYILYQSVFFKRLL